MRAGADARSSTTAPASTPASSRSVAPRGWPIEGYRLAEHPCQRAMLDEVAAAAEVDPASIAVGVDGCGVLDVRADAASAARMRSAGSPSLAGGDRVVARCGRTRSCSGARSPPTSLLMRTLDGWVAKGGAEGLMCACSPDGLGVALKVDGRRLPGDRAGARRGARRLGIDPSAISARTR